MATTAQTLANQANAQHSTGPRTEDGKQRSAVNAFAHGATSRRLLILDETEEQYIDFEMSVLDHYQPATQYEILLTRKVAVTAWRHQRILRIEGNFFLRSEGQFLDPIGPEEPVLQATMERQMHLYQRYITAAGREWRLSVHELESVLEARRAAEAAKAEAEAEAEAAPHAAPPAATTPLTRAERRAAERAARKAERRSPVGFVSQGPETFAVAA